MAVKVRTKLDGLLNSLNESKIINVKQLFKIQDYLYKNVLVRKRFEVSYDNDIEIISNTRNHLLIKVYTYAASTRHGSLKWCISYSEEHWDRYVTKDKSSQYFLWTKDGNKKHDSLKLVGFTINCRGYFKCCYDDYNVEVLTTTLLEIFKINKVKFPFKISKATLKEEAEETECEEEDDDDDDYVEGFCPGYFTDYD